jgi:hypothetical protein
MILDSLDLDAATFAQRIGWELKPEGLCKDDICIPLPPGGQDQLNVRALAARLNMAVVTDEKHGLSAVGPQAGGKALSSARAPELTLPDWRGELFSLSSLRGQRVLLLAWASW